MSATPSLRPYLKHGYGEYDGTQHPNKKRTPSPDTVYMIYYGSFNTKQTDEPDEPEDTLGIYSTLEAANLALPAAAGKILPGGERYDATRSDGGLQISAMLAFREEGVVWVEAQKFPKMLLGREMVKSAWVVLELHEGEEVEGGKKLEVKTLGMHVKKEDAENMAKEGKKRWLKKCNLSF